MGDIPDVPNSQALARLSVSQLRELAADSRRRGGDHAHVVEMIERHLAERELADRIPIRDIPADPDATDEAKRVTEILDGIPGAYEGVQEGLEQGRRGEGIPLDELVAGHRGGLHEGGAPGDAVRRERDEGDRNDVDK